MRSLSIIEGVSRACKDKDIVQTIDDELEWIMKLLLDEIKENK